MRICIRNLCGALAALSLAAPAVAQDIKLPSTLTLTAYDTGSSGFNIAVAVGQPFKKYGTDVRVLPAGNDTARLAPLRSGRSVVSAMGVGACVAVSGVIGFVGLVTPHLVRPFVGHDPARVHIPAMLAGASLLLAADCVSRLIPSTGEIRIGVLTALIGAPFFIWLVLKQRGRDVLQGTGAPS